MNKFDDLVNLATDAQKHGDKFHNKKVKYSATDARKSLQEIIVLAKEMRKDLLEGQKSMPKKEKHVSDPTGSVAVITDVVEDDEDEPEDEPVEPVEPVKTKKSNQGKKQVPVAKPTPVTKPVAEKVVSKKNMQGKKSVKSKG